MEGSSWARVEELFWAALNRPPEERSAFLDQACGGDEQLRREVTSLLSADVTGNADPLRGSAAEALAQSIQHDAGVWIGRTVGPYRVLRQLGQGGMGTVYLAERDDVAKQVALKVVRGALGAPDLVPRFLAERRVLARLEHPGIARLLDAGMTDDGTPWLALEYVDGEPITRWCAARELRVRDRLRLFGEVCEAVAYAHANLVVHRDLKPSNVLVDANGRVKLLDFGIAKLLGEASQESDTTGTGMRLLSPDYAAPEQLTGGRITTATDVHALGVLLFELVTGELPFRREGTGSLTALHAVVDTEPPRPSTVVRRRMDGERMGRVLAGDLDAICLRALAKEPERRYRTADDVRRDVARHLDGLPLEARLPTAGYRLGKFLRRHRVAAAAAAVLVASIVTGLGTALWQAQRAREAAAESEEVSRFLVTLFEASNPSETLGRNVLVRDLLDQGVRRIDELRAQPRVQARMLDVMARAHNGLREAADARVLAESSLATRRRLYGDIHPDVAASLFTLAEALDLLGERAKAADHHRQALDIRRRVLEPDAEATLDSKLRLARLLVEQGESAEGEQLAREVLEARQAARNPDPVAIAKAEQGLAQVFWRAGGKLAQAETLLVSAVSRMERAYGPDDPRVEQPLVPLGSVYSQQGRHEEAESTARRALALRIKQYGPEHLAVYYQLSNVAYAVGRAGRPVEAESLFRQVVAGYRREFPESGHPQLAVALTGIGSRFFERGVLDSAEHYLRQARDMMLVLYGPRHPETAVLYHNLGSMAIARGRFDEAVESLRQAYTLRQELHGATSQITLRTGSSYGYAMAKGGQPEEGEALLREILRHQRANESGTGPTAAYTVGYLVPLVMARQNYAEAESLALDALGYWRRTMPVTHSQRRAIVRLLTSIYEKTSQPQKAAALKAEEVEEAPPQG
jgi:serine/threonine-protein kinase